MWKQILEYGKQLFALTQDMAQIKAEQAKMREEMRQIQNLLQRLLIAEEKQREIRAIERENHEKDERILVLELQREIDKLERRLPPSGDTK